MTMTDENISLCPHCGQLDAVRKVSSIVKGGVSTTDYSMPVAGRIGDNTFYGVQNRTATSVTELAKKLYPPEKPTLSGCAAINPLILLIVGVIIGAIVFCVVLPDQAWSSGNSGLFPGFLIEGIVAGILIALWYRFYSKGLKELEPKVTNWNQAISKWNQLFYCARCDGVYILGQNEFIPIEQMTSFLYK
jgi:hypothetical protein